MQVLCYKYRLLPTRVQHMAFGRILEDQRQLYNAALQERIECYRKTGKGRSYIEQCKALTECRGALPEMAGVPVYLQRGTLGRVHRAYEKFFHGHKRGIRHGFPRFKGKDRFKSFEFKEFRGIQLDGKRLRFKGMPGSLRMHLHRPMPNGEILTATFNHGHKGWSVSLAIRVETEEARDICSVIGLDMGITTLAATSDGLLIPNPRTARKAERELRRRQRALARCKRGSKRRQKVRREVTRLYAKVANTRATELHRISAMLVKRYDLIAVEALNVKGLAKGMLARDVNDAGWAKLVNLLGYKAERAGAHLIKVDPNYTSQDCAGCGTRVPKTLKDRWHHCPSCGVREDRDINAARVILSRAGVGPGAHKLGGCAVAVPGNITLSEIAPSASSVTQRIA